MLENATLPFRFAAFANGRIFSAPTDIRRIFVRFPEIRSFFPLLNWSSDVSSGHPRSARWCFPLCCYTQRTRACIISIRPPKIMCFPKTIFLIVMFFFGFSTRRVYPNLIVLHFKFITLRCLRWRYISLTRLIMCMIPIRSEFIRNNRRTYRI